MSAYEALKSLEVKDKTAIVDAIQQVAKTNPDEGIHDAAQTALEGME